MNELVKEILKAGGLGWAGDQVVERTGLGDRASGILDALGEIAVGLGKGLVPDAAASDARSIPQQPVVPDVPMNMGDTGVNVSIPPTAGASAIDGEMPYVGGQPPTRIPDVAMGQTPEDKAAAIQKFVRENTVPDGNVKAGNSFFTVSPETLAMLDPEGPVTDMDVDKARQIVRAGDFVFNKLPKIKQVAEETGDESVFSAFGEKVKEYFGDEANMTRLALAFNSMRLQPDQGLAAVLGKRLETLQANKRDNKTAVVVAKRLTEMGYPQYAKIVMERPDMAAEVLKQIMQKELKPESSIKTSAVLTDPTTGQQYVVKTDPNTGTVERMNIEGAIGMTPQAKADLEASTASTTLDLKTAQEYGQKVFDQAQSINGQIGRLEEVNRAIDAGAVTGPISQFLPTITQATASLEAAANSLGIDIINSATFGALSETELRLALSTGLPQGLPEAELQKWVKSKISAQKKLRDELFRQAQTLLSGGVRYTEWASNFAKQALEKSAQEQAITPTAPTAPTAAPQSEEELFKTVEIQ